MTYMNSYKNQNWLIPQSIIDMIPADHICFFVEEFVDSLDFTNFNMISEGAGHPSYHPRIIMKVIIQGMLCKERSSRKLASACRENFVFMYLAEKVQPEFSTICRFRRNNKEIVKEAFKETIKLADEHDLIDLNLICTDGSKIKANASKKMCLTKEQIGKLDSIIDKMIEEDISQDEIDKEICGNKEENLTNLEIKNLKEIVKKYRESKNKEKIKEKYNIAQEEFDKDFQLKRVSLSDPDCRMMQNKKGFFELDYNVQFTVDSKNQIIVANDVCKDTDDFRQLEPQVKQTKENIQFKEDTRLSTDCGYNSGENLKFLEDEGITGYIPNKEQAKNREQKIKFDNYEYDEEANEVISDGKRFRYSGTYYNKKDRYRFHRYRNKEFKLNRDVPEFFRERLRMKKKMETTEAKKIYALRKSIVEPVIGNIKYNLGFDKFSMKGLKNAKLELNLASIAHNLKKIWIKRGILSANNKNLIFYLIIKNNQIEL